MTILQCSSYLISTYGFKVKISQGELQTFMPLDMLDKMFELSQELKKQKLAFHIQGGDTGRFVEFTIWGFDSLKPFEPSDALEGLTGGTIQDCIEYIKVTTRVIYFNEQILKRCLIFMGYIAKDEFKRFDIDKLSITPVGKNQVVVQTDDQGNKIIMLSTDCILKVQRILDYEDMENILMGSE